MRLDLCIYNYRSVIYFFQRIFNGRCLLLRIKSFCGIKAPAYRYPFIKRSVDLSFFWTYAGTALPLKENDADFSSFAGFSLSIFKFCKEIESSVAEHILHPVRCIQYKYHITCFGGLCAQTQWQITVVSLLLSSAVAVWIWTPPLLSWRQRAQLDLPLLQ